VEKVINIPSILLNSSIASFSGLTAVLNPALIRDGLKAVLSRQRSRQGSNVLNRGKAEAESSRQRRGRLNLRQGRGDPLKKPSFP